MLGLGKHKNKPLQAAWNKYGRDAFVWEVLQPIDDVNARRACEQELLKSEPNLYNVSIDAFTGPRPGYKHKPESVEKMRNAQAGKPKSAEHRAKLSAYRKGRKQSPETIAKIKAFKHTPEMREAMSQARKGRPWSSKRRASELLKQRSVSESIN